MFLENKIKMYKCQFKVTYVYHLLQIYALFDLYIYAVHRHTDKSNDYYNTLTHAHEY